jgi:hypothetical protein
MRKSLMLGAALLSLTVAMPAALPAYAAGVGAAGGAATGATLGFVFGGPIGAVVGGFSGAAIGSGTEDAAVTFAGNHPVEQVYVQDQLGVGYKVGTHIKVHDIDGDDAHGYFYANNRVWIVDRSTGEVVASPGFVVSQTAVTYVKKHPTASVKITGHVAPGLVLESDVGLTDIPDAHGYAYVYLDDRPALVDAGSRTVVWVE